MKFRIERNRWRCGLKSGTTENSHGEGLTRLLNDKGYSCCLGQVCQQLGVSDENLLDINLPCSIEDKNLIQILISDNDKLFDLSILSYEAVKINDCINTTLKEKEKALIELFAENGHELEFYGEYNLPTETIKIGSRST